ncbi:hypothetical protein [Methylobacterium trifolii]|nr:hypothetical protein [Methylobacterium trifolii]
MTSFTRAALILGVALTVSAPVTAETPEEMAFGFGQFTGSATFCKVPKEKVQELASALLVSSGIKTDGPSPAMTRFTEGVTDGIKAMSAPDAASCTDVVTAFDAAYEKIQ